MDSQRTQTHQVNSKIHLLFPEWRSEKIECDIVTPSAPNLNEDIPIERPRLFAAQKPRAWHDTDLKKLL